MVSISTLFAFAATVSATANVQLEGPDLERRGLFDSSSSSDNSSCQIFDLPSLFGSFSTILSTLIDQGLDFSKDADGLKTLGADIESLISSVDLSCVGGEISSCISELTSLCDTLQSKL